MLNEFENKYNVIFPESENATYKSLLNYSNEKDYPFQRWYRYKEGFSIKFVQNIVGEYGNEGMEVLMDPFAGSGTTVLAANLLGYRGIGFEVNPFSYFLMSTKLSNYSDEEKLCFDKISSDIIKQLENNQFEDYLLPELSISSKVFQPNVEEVMMSCKVKIDKLDDGKIKNLLLLGWLSSIEELSNYRKAGNGLKKRKLKNPLIYTKKDVIEKLKNQYLLMNEDLKTKNNHFLKNCLFHESSLDFTKIIGENTVDGIIFSPPYANCFDYTEIYKLELWFGNFVEKYPDLKILRKNSLKSHLNQKYNYENIHSEKSDLLNQQLNLVQKSELWDKRIPQMLFGYFEDMFKILDNCYLSLKENGFCAIVVGNSAYGGVIIPTDLILADYANEIGFEVDKIEVDRYLITSSQQYKKLKEDNHFLRESVICLKR